MIYADSGPYEAPTWPSRERWAEHRRLAYWDPDCGPAPWAHEVSRLASDYCDGGLAEVQQVEAMLRRIHREMGRELRNKNAEARSRSLFQQKGEGSSRWYERKRLMPDSDRDLLEQCWNLVWQRQLLAGYAALLAENALPLSIKPTNCLPNPPEAKQAMETIRERFESTWRAARGRWEDKIALTPIDDDAWAQELEQRARYEARHRAEWEKTAPPWRLREEAENYHCSRCAE